MSCLSYLLGYLDAGGFDCIEFGDAAQPGRVSGSLRIRPGFARDAYQVGVLSGQGDEVLLPEQYNVQNIETALARFTAVLERQHTGKFLRYFGVMLRGSRR